MPSMVVQGQFQTGQASLDLGITDLMVIERDGVSVLYASSGQSGGLTAFDLGATGIVNVLDTALFSGAWGNDALRDLSLMEVNGALNVVVAGSGEVQLRLFSVNSDGSIGNAQQLDGLSEAAAQVLDVEQVTGSTVFMTEAGSAGISGYTIGDNGFLSQTLHVADTAATYAAEVMAISSLTVAQTTYVISASQSEGGVSVYRLDDTALVNTGNAGVNEGLGIMTPTDMQVVTINGRSFILLASAPGDGVGQSGAITVMELAQDGSLVTTDHVMDTGHTEFGNVQSLEVVEADGRIYVVAGGGDDGLTLFVLMPHGRLQLLSTVSGDQGLVNLSTMAAHYAGGTLHIYAAGEAQGGVTQVSANVSNHGVTLEGSHAGETINGGAQDDILIGGGQNDSILGGAGDDLLEDGLGIDTLHGGDGSDIFILRSDFTHDVIQDFQPGIDRLDLSAWPMLYDISQIGYTATAHGAVLDWRGETLEIFTRNGDTLTFAQVLAGVLNTADRVPDFSSFGGNDSAQLINGSAVNDALVAGNGADTVNGFAGDDFIDAGAGDDVVNAGAGNDLINGGAGADDIDGGIDSDTVSYDGSSTGVVINLNIGAAFGGDAAGDTLTSVEHVIGSVHDDTIYGDDATANILSGADGDDILAGLDGNDTLNGGNGADALAGGNDNDELNGGLGDDRLFGNNGDDLINGGAGDDFTNGGAGADTIFGGDDDDNVLVGGSGNDEIHGGGGSDGINGSTDDDALYGGLGNDRLLGGDGFDQLWGEDGDDTMAGNGDNDTLWGGAGADGMNGDDGDDALDGGAGADRLYGGTGADTLNGGAGDDLLVGQDGVDTFVFDVDWGHDQISGYGVDAPNQPRVDEVIDLSALGISFGDLTIAQSGVHTLVYLTADGSANNSIEILFRNTSEITADDFIFL